MVTPCSTLVRPHLQEQLQFGASHLRGIKQSTQKMMKKTRKEAEGERLGKPGVIQPGKEQTWRA